MKRIPWLLLVLVFLISSCSLFGGKKAPAPEGISGEKAVQLPAKKTEPEPLSASPRPGGEPLRLRSAGKDLSPEEVATALKKYAFYATCWSYNDSFCNPSGEFENRFVDNRDGTVTDMATGLLWQKSGSPSGMTWLEAKDYMNLMNKKQLAGWADWRIPSLEELASLMESSWKNLDLFIAPVFDRTQKHCWSADTRGLDAAWKANFHMGFHLDFPMTTKNHVRLVRSLR